MRYPYKTRKGGATVTVFVPYDCENHCPFCVNKEEYINSAGFSLEKICESIHVMDAITPFCDFVFTGGEPFADLEGLAVMLDCVPASHRVFINTTLPVSEKYSEADILAFTKRYQDKITCINVSRHMQHYVEESNDSLLAALPVPFRVNCVLYQDYPADELVPFMERFRIIPGASIQFRFDYTQTTPENLYDTENDRIAHDLAAAATYIGLDGCRMRCGLHYEYKDMEIVYHKTLPYSTVFEKDPSDGIIYEILYDILIKQTGAIQSDWSDAVKSDIRLDIDAYKKAVFEPYDLKWLERV